MDLTDEQIARDLGLFDDSDSLSDERISADLGSTEPMTANMMNAKLGGSRRAGRIPNPHFLPNAGEGAADTLEGWGVGARQLANDMGYGDEQYRQELDQQAIELERRAQNAPPGYGAGQFAAEVAPALIPGLGAAGAVARVAGSAAIGAGQGAIDPTVPGESRAVNTALGAGLAGTAQAAGDGFRYVINKGLNAITEGGSGEVVDLARKYGIDEKNLAASDMMEPGSVGQAFTRSIETDLNAIPHFQKPRQRLQQDLSRVAEEQNTRYGSPTGSEAELGKGLQDSLGRVESEAVGESTALYNKAWKEGEDLQGADTPAIHQAAGDILNQQGEQGRWTNNKVTTIAERHLPQIDPETGEVISENISGRGMHGMRSDALDEQRRLAKQGRGKEAAAYSKIASAAHDDLIAYADSQTPAFKRAFRRAQDHFRESIGERYREDSTLARLMNTNRPEEIYSSFVRNADKGQARIAYNAMDDEGRSMVVVKMLEDAYETANRNADNTFSPAKWAAELRRKEKSLGVFLRAEDKKHLYGLVTLMEHLKPAGQWASDPQTGQKVMRAMVRGTAVSATAAAGLQAANSDPLQAAGVASPVIAAVLLFGTSPGRRFLAAASKSKKNKKAMDTISARFLAYADHSLKAIPARAAGAAAGDIQENILMSPQDLQYLDPNQGP